MKFLDYYNSYILKHQKLSTRIMHYVGILCTFLYIFICIFSREWMFLLLSPFVVYPFAWTGHFAFEKNIPAAFKNPIKAKMADFYMMWSELVTFKFKNQLKNSLQLQRDMALISCSMNKIKQKENSLFKKEGSITLNESNYLKQSK